MIFSLSSYRDLPSHPHDSATTWPAIAGQQHTHTHTCIHCSLITHTHTCIHCSLITHTHTHALLQSHTLFFVYTNCNLNHTHTALEVRIGTLEPVFQMISLYTSSYHIITYLFFSSQLLSYFYFLFLSVIHLF